jgi:hypothetical protein
MQSTYTGYGFTINVPNIDASPYIFEDSESTRLSHVPTALYTIVSKLLWITIPLASSQPSNNSTSLELSNNITHTIK